MGAGKKKRLSRRHTGSLNPRSRKLRSVEVGRVRISEPQEPLVKLYSAEEIDLLWLQTGKLIRADRAERSKLLVDAD